MKPPPARRGVRASFFGLLLLAWLWVPAAFAHPISITSVHSNLDGKDLDVRVFALVEDLLLFGKLDQGPFGRFDRRTLEEAATEHAKFYQRHLQWFGEDGRPLQGELVDIDFSDIPEEGVDLDDIKRHSFVFHYRFPDVGEPALLTVYQDLGGDDPPVMSDLYWGAFQHGIPADRVSLMHKQSHTVVLDWDADWEKLRENPEAAEARWQEREKDPLQIPGTSAVFTFVYFDEQGVRVEVLVPLLVLDRWMDLPFDEDGRLTVEAQQRIRPQVAEVIGATHTMEIDGQSVEPRLQRIQFHGPFAEDLAMDAPEQEVHRMNGRAGVILRYPVRDVPHAFRMQWKNLEGVPNIPVSVYRYDMPRFGTFFGRQTDIYEWEEPERRTRPEARPRPAPPARPTVAVPAASAGLLLGAVALLVLGASGAVRRRLTLPLAVLCVAVAWFGRSWAVVDVPRPGAPTPQLDEDEVGEVFASLQDNLYRAFRFAKEEQIYDALAAEAAPELVEPLYFQVLDSLRMEDQGGAVSRVDSVDRLSLETIRQESGPRPLVELDAEWLVKGTVEHWGHIHSRTHRHRARFELTGEGGTWKVRSFTPEHVERVERSVEIRR